MNTTKRIISLLMCMLMVLTMVPMSVFATGVTEISEVRINYTFTAPEYAADFYRPTDFTYTVEGDIPVEVSASNADWFLWDGSDWHSMRSNEYFFEGTWCHDFQLWLTDSENYKFADGAKVYLNGVEIGAANSGQWYKAPGFNIEYVAGKPMVFTDPGAIGDSWIGVAIEEIDCTYNVIGGTKPYTFSKVSGPEWINVSADGVISGTPVAVGENDNLEVKVTDAAAEEKTVSLNVGDTYINPADREVISRVEGTIEIPELYCGDDYTVCHSFATNVTVGAPAKISTSSSDFYVSDGLGGYTIYRDTLVAGTYVLDVEVLLSDGEGGNTHVLDSSGLEVIINGNTAALQSAPSIYNNHSYVYVNTEEVTVNHIFDNDTDATCNGCSYTREGCDHQYDEVCDDTCNLCEAVRTVEHDYSDPCDDTCGICDYVRDDAQPHTYTNCEDTFCNECEYKRTFMHSFTDCSDDTCNECDVVRTTPCHSWANGLDTTCEVCGEAREVPYIRAGEIKTVDVPFGSYYVEHVFVPEVSGVYVFASQGDFDTCGFIFNEAGDQLAYNDDSDGRNFAMGYDMTAGTTYLLRSKILSDSTSGTFTVSVVCATHTYADDCDEICDICGTARNDAPHAWSNNCDTECDSCAATRTPFDHVYTNLIDTECDECSATREIRTITPGVAENVEIATPGQVVNFVFTPTVSGKYYFISESGGTLDTMGYVLDVGGNVLDDDDQSGGNGHFKTEYDMTAGTPYVLRAKLYYSAATASFTVRLVCQNHTYGTDCTTECDICGAERNDAPHVWSNACDAQCDNCDATRTPADHIYTNLVDIDCDICGADRTLNIINPGEVRNVDITNVVKQVDFVFIPEVSGTYVFISDSEHGLDTHGYIYNAENSYLTDNDDGAGNTQFKVVYEMTAGTTYILRAKMHSNNVTGSFTVKVVCNTHTYTDICDADCNVCVETREVPHDYDNDCDAQCNGCSATRTPADHIYNNVCDTNCNECDAERTVPDHVYDNDCDRNCNECNASRTVPDHIYDSDCDRDCNECSLVRYVEHNYDDYLDTECNDCANVRTLKYIQYGDTKTVDITVPGEKVSFLFTPTATGNYCFSSHETGMNVDSYGYILNVNGGTITSNDDSGGDGMFLITRKLEAGTTYVLQARLYSSGLTGSFEVTLTCGEHYFDNACDADCNVCDEERFVPDHVYGYICDDDCDECGFVRTAEDHSYSNNCDADCNVCGETRTPSDHIYDNACDAECNECSDTRTVPDHVYDNECDTDCNVCSDAREVPEHVYDNGCDDECNECGETRSVPDHDYDNVCDKICNECGLERTAPGHDYVDGTCTGCGKVYKIPVSEIELTYDINALDFKTTSTELTVTQNIRNNVNTITTGIYKNNGNTYLSDSNFSSNTKDSVYLDAYKNYYICYNLCVNNGYDWLETAMKNGPASESGLTITANGVDITNTAYVKYSSYNNWLFVYVSIGKPVCPHAYDNACDASCNICSATRSVPAHVYDNACDSICNECGFTRAVPHVYDNVNDCECNTCGNIRYFTYSTNSNQVTITKYTGSQVNVVIPSEIGGNPVKTIVQGAFRNCATVVSVSIPETVTTIIGLSFSGNPKLTSFVVDEDNPNYSSVDGVLYNKDKTKLVRYPQGKADASFTIPATVTTIGSDAFFSAENLVSITLPAGIKELEGEAFCQCTNLENINLPGSLESISYRVFGWCESLENIVIPDKITKLEGDTFIACRELKEITIPASVILIETNCFSSCSELATVNYIGDAEMWSKVAIDSGNTYLTGASFTYCAHTYDNACDTECNICGFTRTVSDHTGGTATCKAKAKCSECGEEYGTLNADNHTGKNTVIGKVTGNCGNAGYSGDTVCECGVTISKGKDVPATGKHTGGKATCKDKAVCTICKKAYGNVNVNNHKSVTTLKAKAATYKATGLTEGKKCTACGKVTVAQKTVAMKKLKKVSGLKTKAVKLASGSKTTLTLSWTKVTGAEKYEVQQYINKKWKTIKTTSKTSYTVSKLKANKSYKFRVRAVAGTNKGAYSSTYTAKTIPLKPSLTLKAGKKLLTASWKTVANITGYEVQYSTSSKFTSKTTKTVKITKSKTTKTTVKKLTKGKKYYVKVRAYKTVGKTKVYSAWSTVKNVKVK